MDKLLIYSLLGSIVFGIVDAIFFLFFEGTLDCWLESFTLIDHLIAPIIIGAISASVSLFLCKSINHTLKKKYKLKLKESPFIDILGIIIGTTIVLILYILFMSHRFDKATECEK